MKSSKTQKSLTSTSSIPKKTSQFASRKFSSQVGDAYPAQKTEQKIEDENFHQQKMEATGLKLQAKHGYLSAQGQERLDVLQAKMDGLLHSRLEKASKFGHNIDRISLKRPDKPPIQAKLADTQSTVIQRYFIFNGQKTK
ncbi:MAG: hypothetical protein KME21_23435 [Desmonostoc vinosum HA7617-LM4]|jgi:hypothetical protein|nr:hypothetical protein [Desmonostoc vinosum HA7617-LM4]